MRRNAGGGDYATGADRAALLRSIDDQLSSLAAHGARHNSVMDLATVTVKTSRRQRGIWVSVSADLVESGPVHNHGPEDGPGLTCREWEVDGVLRGACVAEKSERDALADQLAIDYAADLPKQVADRVFALAWENGHANGKGEVEMHYVDLADIAGDAFRAGREARRG